MFRIITAISLLAVSAAAAPASDQSSEAARVLARSGQPGVKWLPSQGIDVNCDGLQDEIFTAEDATHFFVGVVLGPIKSNSKASIVQFERTGHSQDSFCGPFESLTPESLATSAELKEMIGGLPSGYTYSKKCQGLELVAGECDKFHIFWNKQSRTLDWWRL